MCLLREILFTGINAFCTQASVGTLSGGTFTSRHLRGQPLNAAAGSVLLLVLAGAFEEKAGLKTLLLEVNFGPH